MVVYNLIQSTVCTIAIEFFTCFESRLWHIPVYAVNYFFGELINLFLKIGSFSHCDGRRRYTTGQTGMRRNTGICRNGSYVVMNSFVLLLKAKLNPKLNQTAARPSFG